EVAGGCIRRIGTGMPPREASGAVYDAGGALVLPGFVDAHTHPVFTAYRGSEFVRRCHGDSYLQIAREGGGIRSSMLGVREASEGHLASLTADRMRDFLALGTTTIEAKSGYGLTVEDELKSLRAIRTAAATTGLEVSPTLLGAHTVPPEYAGEPNRYVDLVIREMIPRATSEGLAEAVDVFVEESAFTTKQAQRIFEAARSAGLKIRVHADQLTTGGGAELAAEVGAISADHLEQTGDDGLKRLADAGVTAVLLPGAVFGLGLEGYPNAGRMLSAGCRLALATDFNPGSSPVQSMPFILMLAVMKMGMTPFEALWAATLGGALALGRENRVGTLEKGYQADFTLWDLPDLETLIFRGVEARPIAVFKKGELAVGRPKIAV
ncbi:MAG: imidazolonepropionase, partial [Calditrichaeota bacterium]|nr:imidazolonepropionase [Calditrichota bacterium]